MKIPMLLRPARAAQRSEAREVCRITPLARTQSERRRRLALASGFRLLRLSGINRIAAQGSVAGRGWAGPDGRISIKREASAGKRLHSRPEQMAGREKNPDYAFDCHTQKGRRMGKTKAEFLPR